MSKLTIKRLYEYFCRIFFMNSPDLINKDDFSIKPGSIRLLDEVICKALLFINKKDKRVVFMNQKIIPGNFMADLQTLDLRTTEAVSLIQQDLNIGDVTLSEGIRLESKLVAWEHFPEYLNDSKELATLKILNRANIQTVLNQLSDGAQDSESISRISNICNALLKRAETLPYCQLPENLKVFDDLLEKFPNFEAVINVYKRSSYLAKMGDGSLRAPPLLLLGEPGIGKTQFTKELAKLLGTEFLELHMETEQNGASLSGSNAFWSNTKPGDIFNLLTKGKYANPMVLVDEVDKVMNVNFNPLAGLYRLLEVETAKTFEDESLRGITLNASGINWLLTANDINQIPEPLLSRVSVFEIKKPTFEQLVIIAKNIYSDFRKEASWGKSFSEILNDDAAEQLAHHEPRKIKSLMEQCFANAAMDKSKSVKAKHIPGAEKTKGSMRFV